MKTYLKIFLLTSFLSSGIVISCSDEFLEQPPLGAISELSLANKAGVEGSLIQTYRTLQGTNVSAWYTSPSNWAWGSIRSEESYKGSESADQGPELNPVERYAILPNHGPTLNKWTACYDGVGMANTTLRLMDAATDMTDAEKLQVEAQARFIRGFHHFEAKRNFNKVPYVPETAITTEDFRSIKNDVDIYPQIDADLQFAYDNLPDTQTQVGRVNKWAAGAFLGKSLLYQKRFGDALLIFNELIANGKTSKGDNYELLDKFSNVFRGEYENSSEVIFGVQATVGDGTGGANSNLEGELPNPHNDGPGGCCGFFQPTQTLANSFKTTAAGLPDPDPHATNVTQHENDPANYPFRGRVDPRFDWTVGRVGVEYLDWGPALSSWVRNLPNGGPFLPKKNIHTQSEVGSYQISGGWGQPTSGRNIIVMRYADLLLMAAECEIEAGTLDKALEHINKVRTRASNEADFVKSGGVNEADYVIDLYPSFADKAEATTALRKERLLELAMEGHRFYDLVRWGIAGQVLNDFLQRESPVRTHLDDAVFVEPEDLYLPIPEYVRSQSGGNITP